MKTMDALDMMGGAGKGMSMPGGNGKDGDEPMGMVRDARDMLSGASKMMSGKKAEALQMCIDMLDANVLDAETEARS